ncbi:MAG: hypothetical protein R3E32_18665 [Chitinophagales bacterium]
MKEKFRLAAASNILVPIYYLLTEKGYTITDDGKMWLAENEKVVLIAEDTLALAGMVYLYENKGEDWRVDDDKIDSFVEKFC